MHKLYPDKLSVDSFAVLFLFGVTLLLLPWSWFPPFPWLHEHAQWSDIAFSLTFGFWLIDRIRFRQCPRLSTLHLAIACYVASAAFSLLLSPASNRAGAWKLLGICELGCLALVTSDLVSRPTSRRVALYAIVITSIATGVAGIAGLILFYSGVDTHLVGTYGDLTPSAFYARVKSGTTHPNMLASFCIFGAAVLASGSHLFSTRIRRVANTLLFVTALFTFSRGILAFCLSAAIRHAHTRRHRKLVVFAIAAYVVVIAVLTMSNLKLNPMRPFDARFNHETPSARREALTSSLRTLATHPLTGSGVGTSPGTRHGLPFDAHMTLVNIGATMGVPALLSFLAVFFALWQGRRKSMDLASIALWSGLAGLILDGLAQDVEDFRHLWVMIGLAGSDIVENGNEGTVAIK